MKKFLLHALIVVLIGAAITALSAFCPIYTDDYKDVYDLNFGFPVPFFNETTSLVFNSNLFPRYFAPQYFNISFETTFNLASLLLSLAINVAATAVIYTGAVILHRLYRKKHPKKPKKKKDEYRPVFD